MRRIGLACVLTVAMALPAGATAQAVAVHGIAGTYGIGFGGTVGLTDFLNIRGSVGFMPTEPEFSFDEVDFKVSFPSTQFLVTADLHPGGTGFHLSAGLLFSSENIEVDAQLNEDVEIGDSTYTPTELGSLNGVFDSEDVAPYVGIGFGNSVGDDKRLGLFLDLGVAFRGEPTVNLTRVGGSGLTATEEQELERQLEIEESNIEDDTSVLQYWPVLQIGLSLKLGGR